MAPVVNNYSIVQLHVENELNEAFHCWANCDDHVKNNVKTVLASYCVRLATV